MATRKEEEKNERIIRGLLKLPENRRCINCNSLGPQYVCTNFWTYVCTTCSGIHREFTHRVKSVSMAKFTSQEVSSLQGGGNQRAKEIYFKEWDPQRSVPDSSNVDRLRDFIKHVYVDRRFTGDKGSDRPPRPNTGDREDSYQSGSRSPPYDDAYDRRYSNRSSSGGRSPGYDQENRQYSDYKRSPGRPEIINDWRREDRFGNGRKVDDHRVSDGESRVGASPDKPRDIDTSSPPVVRPVREILGENVVPLQVAEPPKANNARLDAPPRTQRTASASSLGSTNGNPAEVKWEKSASLIDFDSNPDAPAVTPPQVQPAVQAAPQPTSSTTDNNWASFDAVPEMKASQPPPAQPTPSVGSLDILSQLSVSAPVMQSQQASVFRVSGVQSTRQSTIPVSEAPHVQPWSGSAAPNPQRPLTPALPQTPVSNPTNIVASGVMQNPSAEVKSNTRKELPADLFTALYAPYPAPVPMWQAGSPYGYGFNMQYNPTMMPLQPQVVQPMPTYPVVSKSANPFDSKETSPAQAPMFPSMASLQGALPNEPPSSAMFYAPAAGAPPSAWTHVRPPSYLTPMPSQAPGFVSTLPPGTYPGQQMLSTMPPPRSQGVGISHANHPAPGSFSTSFGQPNPPASAGGNPFG